MQRLKIPALPLRQRSHLCLMLLLVLTVLVYRASLRFDYIRGLDDDWMIIDNAGIRDFSCKGIKFLFTQDKLDVYYLPLSYASLALDYRLFGLDPFWMKLHNLLLHLASGVLVFLLARRISPSKPVALLTTALFLLHPLQVENVAWAACRRQVLTQFYFLFSLLLYLKFMQSTKPAGWLFYCGSFILYAAALCSKFASAPLPLLPLLFIQLFHPPGNKLAALRRHALLLLPFFGMGLFIYGMNRLSLAHNYMAAAYHYSPSEHLLIFLNSFLFYVVKALYPVGLSIAYLSPAEGKVFNLPFILGAAGGGMLILISVWIYRLDKALCFGLLFFVIFIALSANTFLVVSYLPFTLADRYFYLASAGLFFTAAYVLYRLVPAQKIFAAIALITVAILAFLTAKQLNVWESTVTLLEHNSRHQPSKELLYRLAAEYLQSGDTLKAKAAVDKAESLTDNVFVNNPFYTWIRFADAAMKTGNTAAAIRLFHTALERDLDCGARSPTELLHRFDIVRHIEPRAYLAIRDTLIQEEHCMLKPRRF